MGSGLDEVFVMGWTVVVVGFVGRGGDGGLSWGVISFVI